VKFFSKKTIFGCDARGDGDDAYLTRLTLFGCRFVQVCLHKFHRSDADDLHDHPWPFITFILWRGYIEHTPAGKRRIYPFTLHYRPATWQHRVELIGGKPAITLVVMGRACRKWGFITKLGWQHWREYFKEKGCAE
jgi:hypothetical protein